MFAKNPPPKGVPIVSAVARILVRYMDKGALAQILQKRCWTPPARRRSTTGACRVEINWVVLSVFHTFRLGKSISG